MVEVATRISQGRNCELQSTSAPGLARQRTSWKHQNAHFGLVSSAKRQGSARRGLAQGKTVRQLLCSVAEQSGELKLLDWEESMIYRGTEPVLGIVPLSFQLYSAWNVSVPRPTSLQHEFGPTANVHAPNSRLPDRNPSYALLCGEKTGQFGPLCRYHIRNNILLFICNNHNRLRLLRALQDG